MFANLADHGAKKECFFFTTMRAIWNRLLDLTNLTFDFTHEIQAKYILEFVRNFSGDGCL